MGVFLSHGLCLAWHWDPPELQAWHSSQCWLVPGAAGSGVPLPQGDVLLGCNRMCRLSVPHARKDSEVWAGLEAGTDPAERGPAPLGLGTPGKVREGSQGLTELADVPVSGLAALVVPVEGSRCLHLHAVPKPVSQQEMGEASQRGGMTVTPHRARVASSGHLRTYPWLSGCPKAKLVKEDGSPTSQRKEALDIL